MLDKSLGIGNAFSNGLFGAVHCGDNLWGKATEELVSNAVEMVMGGVNQLRRAPGGPVSLQTKEPYVDLGRLAEIRAASSGKWDLSRLAQLCIELNIAHQQDCYMTVAMLVRAIVDHVPPIFECTTFDAVANNYPGGFRSFKGSMLNLSRSLRHIADSALHTQIRQRESLPTAAQVEFRQDLDVLLGEVIRVTRT